MANRTDRGIGSSASSSGYNPEDRDKALSLSLEEKRKLYRCGDQYVTLKDIPSWLSTLKEDKPTVSSGEGKKLIGDQISLWRGDITKLEIDAICNAANSSLMGGGGVDGAIHAAAGRQLVKECETLKGCDTGKAKITAGYKLPARYVIHTVGPRGEKTDLLRSCYRSCLNLVKQFKLKSVAFPCISTGIYGYPNEPACKVALETVSRFLSEDDYGGEIERVIFCLFLEQDVNCYNKNVKNYFRGS